MNAQIISIGSELVSGGTPDTNAPWLARELAALGIHCARHLTVPDDRAEITSAVAAACEEARLVFITGGLGPTPDDLTRFALADVMGAALRLDQASLDRITDYFSRLRRPMNDSNRVQAMFPDGASPIPNTCGTAPGIRVRIGGADVYVMPGVPQEMRTMFRRDVRPALKVCAGGNVILHHAVHTFGEAEAAIGEKLRDLMEPGRNPAVGTRAADLVISVRLQAAAPTPEAARKLIDDDLAEIRRRLGRIVYGEGEDTLAHAVARLLTEQGGTLATAESCTGGLIAKRLTDIPGSSTFFIEGLVTYANAAKSCLLGVSASLLSAHGAVSPEVAEAMAVGCRRRAGTDYALATTGIAGPAGGTPAKPVGLVYVAFATPDGPTIKELHLGEHRTRREIRDRAAKIALNLLRMWVMGSP